MTVDHDGKIRMDCSSPYAMAEPGRAEGPVPRRLRQRSRLRPARHRHAVGRADEPEPLPRRRDPLPVHAPARLAGARPAVGKTLVSSSMIDRVVQQLGRKLVGGAGRLQVVRRRACSTARSASAARRARAPASCAATARVWTTDKDGLIMDLLAAEITAAHRQGPRRALPGADGASSARRTTRASTPPATPEQKAALKKLSPEAVTATDAGRRADHGQADQGPGQRRADRRAEGGRRPTAGSPPGRRGRRTSTRSTPRASRTRRTWTRSWTRRRDREPIAGIVH